MKSFRSHMNGDLSEKLLRPSAVLGLAAKSRMDGNRAEMEFKKGLDATRDLHRGMDSADVPTRIAKVLKHLLRGSMYRRRQSGSAVGIDVIGHLSTKKKR